MIKMPFQPSKTVQNVICLLTMVCGRFIEQARSKLLCLQASVQIHEPFFRMEGIELEIAHLLTFSGSSLI